MLTPGRPGQESASCHDVDSRRAARIESAHIRNVIVVCERGETRSRRSRNSDQYLTRLPSKEHLRWQ